MMLGRMTTRALALITWLRAYNISADGQHRRALEIILSNRRWRDTRPLHLLGIFQLAHLEQHEEVIKEVDVFLAKAEAEPIKSANLKYVLAFAKWLRLSAAGALQPVDWQPSWLKPDVAFELDDVSDRWKRAFPLWIHPQWPSSDLG